jgi:phosphatidate cytidylyltransferase
MAAADQIRILFISVLCALIVASGLGLVLTRWKGSSPAIANFNNRTNAWWVMVLILSIAFALGKPGVILLFASLSGVALYEFLILTENRRSDSLALAAAFVVFLPVQYYLVWIEWYGLFSIFIPIYGFLLLPVVAVVRGDTTQFMSRIAGLQWGLMICVFCLSHVPVLSALAIPGYEGRNILLIAFLILVVQSSDVMQYVWGKLLGRHKIAPSLSPSKTIEGLLGGVGSATLIGALLWRFTPFSLMQAAMISFIITFMGFLGGLVMSAIKRDRGVKDWGYIIKGHGGVLDRLDSIVFAAPIYFHIIRYWWTV